MEKKTAVATGITLAVLGTAGYGAWALYKKNNPNVMYDLKKGMNKMSKNVEKSMEDMM
ncbi:MAG: hypothetical protein RR047_00675 [Bacilli bacterium]